MKKLLFVIPLLFLFTSFVKLHTLKGTWKYAGGYYNGHKESAPKGYQLQRKYTDTSFTAYIIEKDTLPEKYQAGRYKLKADSCMETETFNAQSAKLTGITLHYHYVFHHDTLYLKGRLPSGMYVLEYWKKVR
ncbi:hypothetical protein MUY27_15505 [Mucilaginibacter sp. RS28]|uniref:Uncharacterized protein n=1 Tax=Mucilaginibacter straminoryzae TaxID=2932774 RepID=A0A9X2BAU2_9SPHI|nr:hypothetical protein [Mucilaginibacter straminoryzae]MCJ8211125.1 hypothetical protein [Mucilaginibacter straminoryzae]